MVAGLTRSRRKLKGSKMRTIFAVGHQNRTHTRIIIKGRLPEGRRMDAAKQEPPPPRMFPTLLELP